MLSSQSLKNLAARHLRVILVFMQAFSDNSRIHPYNRDMPQGRPSIRKRNDFGRRLYDLREAAGLTQAHVAEALGVTQQTYSDLERCPITVHIERLTLLTSILGVTISELCGEAPPKKTAAPRGKLNQVFDAASKLPRRQQQKILDVVEPFIREHVSS
jgi:transcriptional regulator with XRE-family HTH domain